MDFGWTVVFVSGFFAVVFWIIALVDRLARKGQSKEA